MFSAFFYSRCWALWAWGGGSVLAISIWIQVNLAVELNVWYGRFYDLLQRAGEFQANPEAGVAEFYALLVSPQSLMDGFSANPSFLWIALPYIVIATLSSWFTRVWTFRWRQAMTFSYIPRWRNIKSDIEGSSQRIQEDCERFGKILETLGAQVLRALMILVAFIPVLWRLSSTVYLETLKVWQGSLVWVAFSFAGGGLVISWFVGIMLPGLEYENQKVEARFRKDLVLGEDDKKHYAQPKVLARLFEELKANYQRLFLHYGYFEVWQNSYSQCAVVLPFLLVGPSLFVGAVKLGTLMQVSNAFDRVHASFDLFLQNWTTITELRSIYKRLREFEEHLARFEAEKC